MKLHPGYEEKPSESDFREMEITPLSEAQAAYYLREGWMKLYGMYPSFDSLAILWAHSALETGRWKLLRNNNWGNIKRREGLLWTSYEAGEVLDGEHEMFYPYHPQTHFAAWDSTLDGSHGYIKFVSQKERYAKAWIELIAGDPVAYCKELKAGGYFTAPLDKYTAVVIKLVNEFKIRAASLLSWEPPKPTEDPVILPEPEPEPQPELEAEDESQPEPKRKLNFLEMIHELLKLGYNFIMGKPV